MRVDILMATYNGARFIRQQILSVMGQTHINWRLLIHDDGSNDATLSIVNELAIQDDRIVVFNDNIKGLGPGGNFMYLLQFVDSPFVCFCDQDDIWLENKLQILIDKITKKNNDIPQVVFSNAMVYISGVNNLFVRKVYPNDKPIVRTFEQALFKNGGIQGASAIFNQAMARKIDRPYTQIAMHDQILTLAGILYKTLDFTDQVLFLYRHHEHNVTAHIPYSIQEHVKNSLQQHCAVIERRYYNGIASFYEQFVSEMDVDQQRLFQLFLSYPAMNPIKRIVSIVRNRFSLRQSIYQLVIKLILRPYIN